MTRTDPINHHRSPAGSDHDGTVRRAVSDDLSGIVTIHQRAFSHFFLTRLGSEFLRRYYHLVLDYQAGIVLVGGHRGAVGGFVCGFVDPAEFYRLMWQSRRQFVWPAIPALLRHPSLAAGVLQGVQRIQASAHQDGALGCELSSIAVEPETSGTGLGKALIKAFLAEAWLRRAKSVCLTTDAEANDGANMLYRKSGFQHVRRFLQRKGRWMNEYIIHRPAGDDDRGMLP